ncbi:class F sortase [Streptomyces griseus]|uniref:class F sortase n=1 Tax=Streptomyces griseus TaxID=1911 RepID=UPI00083FFF72|nr:class F sortase [Streptomyces griseus]
MPAPDSAAPGSPGPDRSAPARPAGTGRLLTGVAWAVLLLGLWLWGRGADGGISAPTTGDVAAVGRPLGAPLPPAHEPLGGAAPQRVEIPSIGVEAPVVRRGLDAEGAIEPPPFGTPNAVGWYADGTEPGTAGAALLVGHVDTETEPAVFYGLSTAQPGQKVRVSRSDGTVAEFTIDDVQVFTRKRFDAEKAYGPRRDGRAELRLITCGGTYDRASHAYTANVVVSAYLTGEKRGG